MNTSILFLSFIILSLLLSLLIFLSSYKIKTWMNYYKCYEFKNKKEVINFYAKGECVDLVDQHDESYFKDYSS